MPNLMAERRRRRSRRNRRFFLFSFGLFVVSFIHSLHSDPHKLRDFFIGLSEERVCVCVCVSVGVDDVDTAQTTNLKTTR